MVALNVSLVSLLLKINHKNTKIFKNLLLLGNGTTTRSPNKSPPETENNEYVIIGVLVSTAALCLVCFGIYRTCRKVKKVSEKEKTKRENVVSFCRDVHE